MIDRNETYEFENYTYKNYINLTNSEKQMILDWRNHSSNRKWMFNQSFIFINDHLKFIENLENNSESFYWLVSKNKTPIGGVNLIHIQNDSKSAEIGYFLDPDKQGGGLGLDFVFTSLSFAFDVLGFQIIQGNVMNDNITAYLLDAFMGFKYKKEYFINIDGVDVKFHYCELTKDDFYKNIEIKSNTDYFIKFYKKNKHGN